MEQRTIYIADDEQNIREAIKTFLESDGYSVRAFETGDALFDAFEGCSSDLVILDVMMPGSSGFDICAKLRKISTVPIIMLTARDSDLDYATGMGLGSDDYFTKPFSAMNLLMRVKSIFRRIDFERNRQPSREGAEKSGLQSELLLKYGDIVMDIGKMSASVAGDEVSLTPYEFQILKYMIKKGEQAVSRDELLNEVWGYDSEVETRATDDTVRRLRKKLGNSNVSVEAVWGFGFRLKLRTDID